MGIDRIPRRGFLKNSAIAASTVALGSAPIARGFPANEKIVLGVIGIRGRGLGLAQALAKDGAGIAYLCDVDSNLFADRLKSVASLQGQAPAAVKDYRAILDDRAVDAVVVATPDHWHALPTIHACQAGKDVYVEKPVAHNIWEGQKMIEAARKHQRIVQVGMQARSGPYVHKAIDYIRSGKLGDVRFVKVFNMKSWPSPKPRPDEPTPDGLDFDRWLGAAPLRDYNRNRHNTWNLYWDYSGGDMVNDTPHQMDIARLLVGREYPLSVVTRGGKYFPGDQDAPDTQVVTYDFGGLIMTLELTLWTPYMDKIAQDVREGDLFPYWPQCATRVELYGTKGVMYMGRHGGGWQVFGPAKKQSRPGELVAQEYGRVPERPHLQNFLECIRTRKLPNGDIREGHLSTLLCHLGNISYRLGGRGLKWDAQTESFPSDEDANRLLKRTYRQPYEVPDSV
jgi:predicted dehydrogenase